MFQTACVFLFVAGRAKFSCASGQSLAVSAGNICDCCFCCSGVCKRSVAYHVRHRLVGSTRNGHSRILFKNKLAFFACSGHSGPDAPDASQMHLGRANIWETSRRHLRNVLEASGRHLGSIWEASGKHLRASGGIWGYPGPEASGNHIYIYIYIYVYIYIYMFFQQKARATEFRVHGSDLTLNVYSACAQDFADTFPREPAKHIGNPRKNRQNPYGIKLLRGLLWDL